MRSSAQVPYISSSTTSNFRAAEVIYFPRRAAALGEDLFSVNTRLRILLSFAVAAVVVLSALAVVFPREPTYQGRQLGAWLRDLENGGPQTSVRNVRAREAVRQIGRASCRERV